MAYTVGSRQVINPDKTTHVATLTAKVGSQDYIEITTFDTVAAVGKTNVFHTGGPDAFGNPQPGRGDIQKFSFSSQTLVDTTGNLANIGIYNAHKGPANNETDAFVVGGTDRTSPTPPFPSTTIQKYPFTISSGTATDVGDLNFATGGGSALSSTTDAYFLSFPAKYEKFPFSISSGTASILSPDISGFEGTAYSGVSNSLRSGGNTLSDGFWIQSGTEGNIYKFPFASGTSISDIGDLAVAGRRGANCQDHDNSFVIWAISSPTNPNDATLEKFPFSIASGTAVDVGTMAPNSFGFRASGGNSPTDGYVFGATPNQAVAKFPFAISGGTGTPLGPTSPIGVEYSTVSSD